MGSLADVAAEDLQDPRDGALAGELGGVVGSLGVGAAPGWAPPAPLPQVGAVVENRGQPVVVTPDLALGRLPDADALCGADGAGRLVGPERRSRVRLQSVQTFLFIHQQTLCFHQTIICNNVSESFGQQQLFIITAWDLL